MMNLPLLSRIKQKIKRHIAFMVSRLKLHKIDNTKIPSNTDEIRLFSMMRNESLRLPYFLDYYFSKGVDRIFLIDNGSSDESVSLALARNNVHVFRTLESFTNYSNWMEILLDKYGINHWCIAADIDEIFYYPDAEIYSLKDLSIMLDKKRESAIRCFFLDMYSNKPVAENEYKQSENPFDVCPYFDADFEKSEIQWINKRTFKKYSTLRYSGNMRKRVFNVSANLTKVPFFKYEKGVFLARGIHAIDGARISSMQGVVFHFKYLQDFNNRVIVEAKRGQHEGGAALYKEYAQAVNKEECLNLHFNGSIKFFDSQQLIDLKLMKK